MLITSRKDQQTSFGARMLDRGAYERIDQLLKDDLTGHCLRDPDDGCEIEVFDGREDCGCRIGHCTVRSKVRIDLFELANLSVSPPAKVAVPRVSKVRRRDLLEPAGCVKASGQLVR